MKFFTLLISMMILATGQVQSASTDHTATSTDAATEMTNDVFFFITEGGPLASLGALVTLSNADTSYSFTTSDPFGGEVISGMPFGTYSYSISKECFETITDSLVVDENGGMGISVFADLQAGGTNNVFFFITEGGPLAALNAEVTLFNLDTSYSFTTSDPFGGEMIIDVPSGLYSYSVTKDCFLDASGEVDVVCDPAMGVSVFVDLEEGADNDVFFFVTEGGPLASLGATITMSNADTTISFVTSDPFGGEVLSMPGGTYNLTINKNCFNEYSGTVLVGCNNGMGISVFADLQASTTNDVFFFISEGSPLASLGALVTLSNADTSFSFTTSDPFGGEVVMDVPNGTYDYTVTKTCFEDATGTVSVDCNEGMGISLFIDLQPTGSNNVFFFITEGGPLAALDAEVTFFNDDTSYTFITSDPFGGEMIADVPIGTYTYIVTKDCFLTSTGEVEVICDPNMGISVFIDLEEGADNDVFFFVTEGGPLASLGATITMSNADTTISFVTSDPFGGEMLANVPGGTYNLSITKDCFDEIVSTVLVGCNGGMGISVFADLLSSTTSNVFFFITEGSPLASLDAQVTLFNDDTIFSFTTSDPFGGEVIMNVPYGTYEYTVTKTCFADASGTLTVDCNEGMGISIFENLQPEGSNNVFFFISEGSPLASLNAEVTFFNADTSYSFITSDPFGGEMIADVQIGIYTYTVTKDCFLMATGEVEVFCDPNMGVSVFINLEEGADNDVFFFVTEGGPLASLGATITLSRSDTVISFVTSDPFGGEMLANVPGGTYNLTIAKNCFDEYVSTVLVGCNGGMGISVFADLQATTTNNVFFFITEGGPLAALDAEVTLSNSDTSFSFTTSDPFGGELLSGVPYGEYTYTISKECYIDASGDVTVDCNEGNGVSVFANLEGIALGDSIAASICNGESFSFGSQTLTESGIYEETFGSANGCDSVVTLTLTVDTVNVSVDQQGAVLTAEFAGATYQWLDCNAEDTAIDGATEQTFVASEPGDYAVEISVNGCIDTSECINVTSVATVETPWPNEVLLFPNPAGDYVVVEIGQTVKEFDLFIVNAMGQVVIQKRGLNHDKVEIDLEELPAGHYILKLISDQARDIQKFIKA